MVLKRFTDNYSVSQVIFLLSGMMLNLTIAALLMQDVTQSGKEDKNEEKSEKRREREIFTVPVILFCVGSFLLQSGKQSQFPFFTPFAQSIGLKNYEPASILTIMNILDIIFRPIGGVLSRKVFLETLTRRFPMRQIGAFRSLKSNCEIS